MYNRIAVSLFGLSEDPKVLIQSTQLRLLALPESTVFFGRRSDFQVLSEFSRPSRVLDNELDFLKVLSENFDVAIYPRGRLRPEVCPILSVVFSSQDHSLSEVQKRDVALRADLILVENDVMASEIKLLAGVMKPTLKVAPDLKDLVSLLRGVKGSSEGLIPKTNGVRFTVVTPSFNHAEFIEDTIQSVLNQDYSNFEYWVIDGGSTDGTLEILKRYEVQGLRWVSERDKGYADAVNKGFGKGDGNYLMWLPSDDTYCHSKVLSQMAAAIEATQAEVVFGDSFYTDIDGNIVDCYRVGDFNRDELYEWCMICQPSTAFSRSIFERVGGLSLHLKSIADYDLWQRMAEAGARFERIGSKISYYRLHSGSITTRQKLFSYSEILNSQIARRKVAGSTWVKAAIGELRSTAFGLKTSGYVRPKRPVPQSEIKRSGLGFIKALIGWDRLTKNPNFQTLVLCLLQLGIRLGKFKDRVSLNM